MKRLLIFSFLLMLFVGGCAQSMYRWGVYEDSIYGMYRGGGDPQRDIDRLSDQVEETIASNEGVPPGLYAHLAYLHASVGNYSAAKRLFLLEKEEFPESTVFVDTLIGQISK